ncbi:MAG: type II toxin-antitoxin system Phd/YefM family antitoxin [Deltaproteobacteria bacterium]|nr:type II toxin-antitoxin system Phd/YefM family antitoxin [Deltaproteobacteria bacterium]MBW2133470.1 type II toxin-antitoxin system Phd/YefM family antitoxin [Deltaproteobacteria bacterium]
MIHKVTVADVRKNFSHIINKVAYGKESFVLTRRGQAIAALVSIEDLKLIQDLEERLDIEDAWKARNETDEAIPWESLKAELDL